VHLFSKESARFGSERGHKTRSGWDITEVLLSCFVSVFLSSQYPFTSLLRAFQLSAPDNLIQGPFKLFIIETKCGRAVRVLILCLQHNTSKSSFSAGCFSQHTPPFLNQRNRPSICNQNPSDIYLPYHVPLFFFQTRCGRAVLASFTDSEQNPAGLKARALLCMREGRYKEAEVTYLRLLELMRDQKLADADTLLLAKVGRPILQGVFRELLCGIVRWFLDCRELVECLLRSSSDLNGRLLTGSEASGCSYVDKMGRPYRTESAFGSVWNK
jgi:hypothetical protein